MSSKKQEGVVFLVGALAVAGAALGLVWFASDEMGENLVYYWTPAEVHAAGAEAYGPTIRLGGLVKEGTLDWNPEAQTVDLVVTDTTGAELPIHAQGAPPQMLREGIGVVVEGTLRADGTFETDRLMVKHSNEYKSDFEDMSPAERAAMYETISDDI
ncbi:MAG: cytochrome c maturation protein CcmE [Proteobacteria bacterium]|nr:cytochrome c maturation protein CcmE [Pseudomonadota bacterium]MCP4917485.1 cytochrome c maturation protein CcmE [Pseudomonadota bacterium]